MTQSLVKYKKDLLYRFVDPSRCKSMEFKVNCKGMPCIDFIGLEGEPICTLFFTRFAKIDIGLGRIQANKEQIVLYTQWYSRFLGNGPKEDTMLEYLLNKKFPKDITEHIGTFLSRRDLVCCDCGKYVQHLKNITRHFDTIKNKLYRFVCYNCKGNRRRIK